LETSPSNLTRARVARSAGAFVFLAGGLTILGWEIDSSILKDPFHTNFMAPNTALCFVLAGLAVMLQSAERQRFLRVLSQVLGALVALIGAVTTLEYISGVDFGIDRIFLASKLGYWPPPNLFTGRIAPNTADAFALLGVALLCRRSSIGTVRTSEVLVIPALLISFLSIVGYAYQVESLYGLSFYSAMALQTALCLFVLGIGILWTPGTGGLMEVVLSNDSAGVTARRLVTATMIALPFLGWVSVQAERHRVFNHDFGTSLGVVVGVVLFSYMIIRTAYVLRDLEAGRRRAEESLRQSHAELESLVKSRTESLRQLSAELIHSQDEERRRIARELHDGISQYLSALAMNLSRLEQPSADSGPVVADCNELLDRAIKETRTLSHLLHPPLLDEMGFTSATEWYVEGYSKRSGVEVNLTLPSSFPRLPQEVETSLFRVLQEALTNIHRHSGSKKAEIGVDFSGGTLVMLIRDHGKGLPEQVLSKWRATGMGGIGLSGMQERISELGGKIEIESTGEGTLLVVSIPIAQSRVGERSITTGV